MPTPNHPAERIQKVLARDGIASRRTLEVWIQEGRISVNGKTATLGQRIQPADHVKLNDKALTLNWSPMTQILIYHKPVGVICTHDDPKGKPTIYEHLPPLIEGKWISMGRLDINSEGLLLLTNDGALANAMMHPSNGTIRQYLVRLSSSVDSASIQELLRGVELEDGMAQFQQCTLHADGKHPWYRVQLCEGRNRLVRRLWASQGVMVSRLMRIRFGDIKLPKSLPAGAFESLSENTVRSLQKKYGF